MKRLIKACVLCLAFSLVMLVAVSAATPSEMYENGVVSDDGIRLGDARDGEVSDVSEGGEIFTGEGTGMLGDMMNGSENSNMPDNTSTPDNTSAPDTTNAPMTTENDSGSTSGNTEDDGEGMGLGVIIAVIVVIAVVVIIFLLLPKRRG